MYVLFTLDFCVCISMHSVNSFCNILELRNPLVIVLSSCYCFVMHSHAQSLKNFVLVVVLFSVIFLLLINIQKLLGYEPGHISLRKLKFRDS